MKTHFSKSIFVQTFLTLSTMSCGIRSNHSSPSAITPPQDVQVGLVESFWIYENSTDTQSRWTSLQNSNLQFYPGLLPTTGSDYFWVTDTSTKVSLVPDRFQRHLEGKLSRLEFSNSLGHAFVELNHTLFDGMEVGVDYLFIPTFEISGKIDDELSLSFHLKMECFSIDPDSHDIEILDSYTRSVERTVKISRPNFETETYTLETEFKRPDYTDFKSRCDGLGGADIASSFDFDIQPLKVSNSLKVDFPGIFIKRTTRS